MESIVVKSVSEITHQCSLNQFGPRKFGSIYELILTKSGVKSTVGLNNGTNTVDEEKRKSKHYRSVFNFTLDKISIISALKNLVPEDKRDYVEWLPNNHMCDVITYTTGGFFVKHRDTKVNRLHYATLLIFPPACDQIAHTGGELIITRADGSKFVFESALNKDWTFIAFHQELEHECKIVTSGTRLVIKTELKYRYFRPIHAPDNRDLLVNDYPITDGNLPIRNEIIFDIGIDKTSNYNTRD